MVGAKLGMGFGGLVSGWLLSWGGFQATAKVQGAKAVTAISTSFVWLPIVLALLIVGILYLFYKLDEDEITSAKAVKDKEVTNSKANENA